MSLKILVLAETMSVPSILTVPELLLDVPVPDLKSKRKHSLNIRVTLKNVKQKPGTTK